MTITYVSLVGGELTPKAVALRNPERIACAVAPLVADEYGRLVGLVTLEDVLEEIVGEIREPGETATPSFTRAADGSYVIDGSAPLREVGDALAVQFPRSVDYTTLAGFLISTLGTIPSSGRSVSFGGYRWTVTETAGPRIITVKAEPGAETT